jgi:hypothetical protein
MTDIVVDPTLAKLPKRSRSSSSRRTRRRDYVPGIAAAACLLLSFFLYGAAQSTSTLIVSGCIIVCALVSVGIAGPHRVTVGMAAGALVIWLFTATGWAGRLERAAPELAALFAAGAMWTIGYVCARQRGALDIAWTSLIWASLTYCIWVFFSDLPHGPNSLNAGADAPLSPTNASLLFGLLALLGSSRILHVVKQMDAEALSRSEMIDRLLRDGLGGLLLTGFALTCLILSGSIVGMLLSASVMLAHAWWDTRAIVNRDHRSTWVRWLGRFSPFIALALAGWGVAASALNVETVAAVAASGETPRFARLTAYLHAIPSHLWFGHGLGSIELVGAKETTLTNALAMQAPGDAQNMFVHWLVEAGLLGSLALTLVVGAMHILIIRGFSAHTAPRTFLRLAIAMGVFMLLHGIADSSLDLPSAVWLYALVLGAACGVATGRPVKIEQEPI